MAETRAVWGIDIGQAGLKAIRLRYAEAAGQVIAVAFDYVPHPKLLSQPDAIPEELIPQALEKFLSRNDVSGDAVAISVPGQAALTRFIQLPPVERGKVAEIVKYEARQQIPFALEDVIWDYQVLAGGQEESGYLLGAEVGLFAMKREQVSQFLRPFTSAKVEVDLVQIAPLALYNVLAYDQLGLRPENNFDGADQYNIVLDMGADNTTLLVSNGRKIWIRNVPIGGNHFTRALTKEMKLTFAKAEHLKCNATKSDDPRAVFQALRPVFNDYVAEIQRSIGYFSSVNREAKIEKVVGCGNGFKLAGLQKFLQQNLQYPVERVDSFQAVVGDAVLSAPLFEENILSFAVPYGLALQQLGLSPVHTSLLPPEIAVARKIRGKKPWAVGAAAAALLIFSLSAFAYGRALSAVKNPEFEAAIKETESLKSEVGGYTSAYTAETTKYKEIIAKGDVLVKPLESRGYWPDLYRAINEALPRESGDVDQIPIGMRKQVVITSITTQQVEDLSKWYDWLKQSKSSAAIEQMSPQDREKPPAGPGFIVRLDGMHYNTDPEFKVQFLQQTLLKNLQQWTMQHEGTTRPVPVRLAGITHATVITDSRSVPATIDPSGETTGRERGIAGRGPTRPFRAGIPMGVPGDPLLGGADSEEKVEEVKVDVHNFVVQFAWRQTPQDRIELFYDLHQLFLAKPETTFASAQEAIKHRLFSEEDFNAYVEMHKWTPPAGAAAGAATPAATPAPATPAPATPPATTAPAATPPGTTAPATPTPAGT